MATPSIVRTVIFGFFFSIKWFLPFDLSFHSNFLFFFVFLSPICCGVWLCRRSTIVLLVGFSVDDSYDIAILIKTKKSYQIHICQYVSLDL